MSDKIQIFRHLSDFSKRHFEGIETESPERIVQLLKEARDLCASLDTASGELDTDTSITVMGIMRIWESVQEEHDISDETIAAASMPFTTLTGRQTADPVFRQRCDM